MDGMQSKLAFKIVYWSNASISNHLESKRGTTPPLNLVLTPVVISTRGKSLKSQEIDLFPFITLRRCAATYNNGVLQPCGLVIPGIIPIFQFSHRVGPKLENYTSKQISD